MVVDLLSAGGRALLPERRLPGANADGMHLAGRGLSGRWVELRGHQLSATVAGMLFFRRRVHRPDAVELHSRRRKPGWGGRRACAANSCNPIGACCIPNGNCLTNVSPTACASLGGVYRGNGSTCANPCTGGCCFPTSFCLELTKANCDAGNGTWHLGATCADGNGNGTADICELCAMPGRCQRRSTRRSERSVAITGPLWHDEWGDDGAGRSGWRSRRGPE